MAWGGVSPPWTSTLLLTLQAPALPPGSSPRLRRFWGGVARPSLNFWPKQELTSSAPRPSHLPNPASLKPPSQSLQDWREAEPPFRSQTSWWDKKEACTAFGAGGRKEGPRRSLQASRKAFNAIKAELLASESVFYVNNLVPSVRSMCSLGRQLGLSYSPGLGVKEGQTSS